jgi:NADH-quinone oxidoreductase subunit C
MNRGRSRARKGGFSLSKFALDKVAAKFPEALAERFADRTGAEWGVVKPAAIAQVASLLKNDPELDFKLFISIDCADRLQLPVSDPRYEVSYFFGSLSRNEQVRLKVRAGGDSPEIPTISAVYQGANWFERLVWDFYGVRFSGHPDLRRILLYEEFKGHPLRKDYPLRQRQPLMPERNMKDYFRGPGSSGIA